MKVNIGNYTDNPDKRKIEVKIHDYDLWSMDHTLSLLIVPMLKKLKKIKNCAPIVKDKHVPKHLKAKNSNIIEGESTDVNFFKRWDYVLDEMIWTFKAIKNESFWDISGKEEIEKFQKRLKRGLKLFGFYFQSLWW